MATSRRGRRRIVVDGRIFYWKLELQRHDIGVDVCSEDALVRGQHGRWLRFDLPRTAAICARLGPDYLREITPTPRIIRAAILHALHHTAFDDRSTEIREVRLDADAVASVLASTVDALVLEDLTAATAALADGDGRRFAQAFHDLGRIAALAAEVHAQIDDWLACNADALRAQRAIARQGGDGFLAACARLGIILDD